MMTYIKTNPKDPINSIVSLIELNHCAFVMKLLAKKRKSETIKTSSPIKRSIFLIIGIGFIRSIEKSKISCSYFGIFLLDGLLGFQKLE